MLRALDDLVHQGKVRYIACSNYPAWRLCDALWISDAKDLARFICYQAQYSLVVRDIEQELVPLCIDKGLGIVAWGPMAGGFLTGKYQPGQRKLAGTRSDENWVWQASAFAPSADQTLAAVLEAARALGHSPTQVALRWVLGRPGISAIIAGARTAEQFRDSLGAAGWDLPQELRQQLDAISRLPDRYPESMERNMHERRNNAIKDATAIDAGAADARAAGALTGGGGMVPDGMPPARSPARPTPATPFLPNPPRALEFRADFVRCPPRHATDL